MSKIGARTGLLTTAWLTLLLGLIDGLSWHLFQFGLISAHSFFIHQHYHVALATAMAGSAMLLFLADWRGCALCLSLCVTFLGLGTLYEYLLSSDLGIDLLFIEGYDPYHDYHQNRMAPLTAISLALIGAGLSFITGNFMLTKQKQLLKLIGMGTVSMAVIGITAYLIGIEAAPDLAPFTYLDPRPCLEILLLGIMIAIYAWTSEKKEAGIPPGLARPCAIATLLGAIFLWQSLNTQETERLKSVNEEILGYLKNSFETAVSEQQDALKQWTARLQADPLPHEFTAYLDSFSPLLGIEWSGPTRHFIWKIHENRADIFDDHDKTAAIANLQQQTSLIHLSDSHQQLLIYLPIKEGYVLGSYDLKQLLHRSIPAHLLQDYAIVIEDPHRILFSSYSTHHLDLSSTLPLAIAHLQWTLSLYPRADLISKMHSPLPLFTLIMGWLLAGFVYLCLYFWEAAHSRAHALEKTVTALSQSKNQTEAILQSVGEGVYGLDLGGQLTFINEAGGRLLGYRRQDLIGKSQCIFLKPDHPNGRHLLASSNDFFLHKNGALFPAEFTTAPLWKEGRLSGAVVVFRDITERKKTEKMLLQFLEKLEKANEELHLARLAAEQANMAKSAFLANMSHEIRTPLHGVISITSLLQRMELNEKQRHYVEQINLSGKILLEIINNILDLSKIEAGELRLECISFNLLTLLKEIEELMGIKAEEKGLQLSLDLEPDMPHLVVGDPLRLRQILMNLISNAIKFTEQGSVSLHLECLKKTAQTATFRYEIHDTGIGLSQAEIQHLFEKFSQGDISTTRKYGGTGLGLAICKQLSELMGGAIGCQSRPGQGSTFWVQISLPLAKVTLIKSLSPR